MTQSRAGLFVLRNHANGTGRIVAEFGHAPGYLESLAAHYVPLAPDTRVAPRLPAGTVTSDVELVPSDHFRRSVFYTAESLRAVARIAEVARRLGVAEFADIARSASSLQRACLATAAVLQ